MASDHRADVQGLRAVAVLTVVAAHAGVPFLPGGYVGVDVFFVISGYLIAGLLYREVDRDGSFSLSSFWSRRARRILPAATLVTAVTVVFSLFWMSLIDTRQVAVDAVWSSLFAANVHFAQQGVYYFAHDAGPSPLQHYWSLAVEEQFYVVWPLVLLGCLALAGRRRSRPAGHLLPRGVVLVVLVAVAAASFAWSVHQSVAQPGTAYFSTFTRAWELAVGALAALLPAAATRRIGRGTATVMALLGLVAVGAACVLFTPETVFPGYAAALPVGGAALLLLAGAGPRAPLTSPLLTSAPMQVIGDWSYSMYLWHWPALVLTERLLGRPLEPWERAAAVLCVFVLAGLSYHFVEQPFRAGRGAHAAFTTPKALLLYPLSITMVAATVTAATYWTSWRAGELTDNPPIAAPSGSAEAGDHDDAVALVRASVAAAREDLPIPSDLDPELLELRSSIADVGDCDYSEDVRTLCPRGDEDGHRTVVVVGDSHARAWIPAFDKIAVEGGWTAYYLVKSQCTAAHVTVAPLDEERPFTECDDFHAWVEAQVDELEPELVVVASSPPVNGVYDGPDHVTSVEAIAPLLADGYDDLFAALQRSADRVVLLRDVPKSADDPGTCLTSGDADLGDCLFVPVERSSVLADVAVASARRTGVDVVDPLPWLCFEGECPVVIGGTLAYRDTDHLTTEYAASLSGPLGAALDMVDP